MPSVVGSDPSIVMAGLRPTGVRHRLCLSCCGLSERARASRRRTRRLSTLRVAIIFLFCQTPVERRNPREVKLMNHVGAYAASAFMNSAQYLVESFIV
jgi:hypothetical protein